jgi:hypothetical protein
MKILTFITLLILATTTQAAVVSATSNPIETNKRTHIIVVGIAEKLGDLFFKSAETKAKLILSLYPNDQIVILTTNDEKDLVRKSQFKTIETTPQKLNDKLIASIVEKVSEVASLDIFAHSNALEGAILDKSLLSGSTLSEKSELWGKLKEKIKPNSYVMIHGCNAAVKTAPTIANDLGIAVIGALTATDFEYVYENNKWIHDTEVKTLKRSSDRRVRMKPDNYSYSGHWGDWSEGGFPTYKVFCGHLDQSTCGLSAIEAFVTFPSVLDPKTIKTKEEFKQNVFDFLCPFSERKDVYNDCVKNLESSLSSSESNLYTPFNGKTLNCSFERCEAHFKCNIIQISVNPGSCKLINENDKASDAFVKEFKFYLDAYDLKTDSGKKALIE